MGAQKAAAAITAGIYLPITGIVSCACTTERTAGTYDGLNGDICPGVFSGGCFILIPEWNHSPSTNTVPGAIKQHLTPRCISSNGTLWCLHVHLCV